MKKGFSICACLVVLMVLIVCGCNSPKLSQTPIGPEEQEWESIIKQNYPSWQHPKTIPPSEEDNVIEEPVPQISINEDIIVDQSASNPEVIVKEQVIETNAEGVQKSPGKLTGESYTVQKGDCLWRISEKFYGDGKKWTLINEANSGIIANPNKIKPGMVLTIPPAR
mgnify:CR=1 FL=1